VPRVPDWDSYFMTMVYLAGMRSKDMSTHIGAVFVGPDREIRSTGYNGFPRRLNDYLPERQERPEKYYWFEHGERNGMFNAVLMGVSLKGCTMYTNGMPCMDCGRGAVQSGIIEVVTDKKWDDANAEKWAEHTKRTIMMFDEVGVKHRQWDGELIDIFKFKNGEIFGKNLITSVPSQLDGRGSADRRAGEIQVRKE